MTASLKKLAAAKREAQRRAEETGIAQAVRNDGTVQAAVSAEMNDRIGPMFGARAVGNWEIVKPSPEAVAAAAERNAQKQADYERRQAEALVAMAREAKRWRPMQDVWMPRKKYSGGTTITVYRHGVVTRRLGTKWIWIRWDDQAGVVLTS